MDPPSHTQTRHSQLPLITRSGWGGPPLSHTNMSQPASFDNKVWLGWTPPPPLTHKHVTASFHTFDNKVWLGWTPPPSHTQTCHSQLPLITRSGWGGPPPSHTQTCHNQLPLITRSGWGGPPPSHTQTCHSQLPYL